jgi:hypothetical protein
MEEPLTFELTDSTLCQICKRSVAFDEESPNILNVRYLCEDQYPGFERLEGRASDGCRLCAAFHIMICEILSEPGADSERYSDFGNFDVWLGAQHWIDPRPLEVNVQAPGALLIGRMYFKISIYDLNVLQSTLHQIHLKLYGGRDISKRIVAMSSKPLIL